MKTIKQQIREELDNTKPEDIVFDINQVLQQLGDVTLGLVNPRIIIDTFAAIFAVDCETSTAGDEHVLSTDPDEFLTRLGAEPDDDGNLHFPHGISGVETIDHIQTVYLQGE